MRKLKNSNDYERYTRQLGIKALPDNFQDTLLNSSVLILGAGGLGCAASQYLASTGIGKITIVDKDKVELSNLNRQILYNENDINKFKATLCADRIHNQNPDCKTIGLNEYINEKLLDKLVPQHDIVLDMCDNYETRKIIAYSCHKHDKNCVIGAVNGLEGFIMLTNRSSSCFLCLYPKEVKPREIPPRVLGSIPGCIGTLASTKCILALLGLGKFGVLYCIDFMSMNIDEVNIPKDDNCAICSV